MWILSNNSQLFKQNRSMLLAVNAF